METVTVIWHNSTKEFGSYKAWLGTTARPRIGTVEFEHVWFWFLWPVSCVQVLVVFTFPITQTGLHKKMPQYVRNITLRNLPFISNRIGSRKDWVRFAGPLYASCGMLLEPYWLTWPFRFRYATGMENFVPWSIATLRMTQWLWLTQLRMRKKKHRRVLLLV